MIVFVIDDEKNVLEDTKKTILSTGEKDVFTFDRCAKALEAAENGNIPDAVFCDIELPGLSGLEFAERLKEISPKARVIFVTGYEKYALQAFRVRAQGYRLKPLSCEDVKEELDLVRQTISVKPDRLVVRCFGHFDVFWQGEPLIFKRKQSKELFAYLIDREGAACSSGEIALALWKEGCESKAEHNRIRVLVNDLRNTLREIGMEDVLIRERRELAIRRDLIDCDYYRMLEGEPEAVKAYRGEYMVEYGWAEATNGSLYFEK